MATKGGGKGSALAPYGCWVPLSVNLWNTYKCLYVTAHTDSTPSPHGPQSGYLGERETRGNARESTLERAAAELRECADYPLLSTHPPNSLHATWRTCTRVQLAEDYRSMSPHATCDLAPSIWILFESAVSFYRCFIVASWLYYRDDILTSLYFVLCLYLTILYFIVYRYVHKSTNTMYKYNLQIIITCIK